MPETNIFSNQPPTKLSLWQKLLALPLWAKVGIGSALFLVVAGGLIVAFILFNAAKTPTPASNPTPEPTEQQNTETSADAETKKQEEAKKEEAAKPKPTTPGTNTGGGGTSAPPATTPPPSGGTIPPPSNPGFPNASNTGVPAGTSLTNYTGPTNNNSSNIVLENLNFPTAGSPGYYIFSGNNVTIRNSYFASGVLFNGDNITVEHNTINDGVSFSGTAGVTFRYNNVQNFAGDGLHVTADSGPVSNVTLAYNYVHAPNPGCGDHADGLQVRGVNGLSLVGNTIDMGPWVQVCGADVLNAAVFLEDANGGNSSITINGNYVNGGGYIVRLTPGANQTITNNAFGNDGHYGQVLNDTDPGNIVNKSGNYFLSNGNPITF